MPELPEVETVVRGLREFLPGRQIIDVRLGKIDFIDDPLALVERLPGSRIVTVRRYGKFISVELAPGHRDGQHFYLLIHLGMTGRLTIRRAEDPVLPHTHSFFVLDDGHELRYTDIRRFGRIRLVPESQMAVFRGGLGLDPLEASEEEFRARLAGRRAMVKALLLNQHVLRGMGNIYADESLWRARVHPARHAVRLRREQLARLYRSIQSVLTTAIRLRGSSISDYVDARGNPGEYQRRHRVYRREGKRCFRCGEHIRRVIVAGRSSYFCPRCQPAPRRQRTGSHRSRRR